MKTLMQIYGAYVLVTPTARDRWVIIEKCVEEFGWIPCSGYIYPPNKNLLCCKVCKYFDISKYA